MPVRKSETYGRKVDTGDVLLGHVTDVIARIKIRHAALRMSNTSCPRSVAKCMDVDDGIFRKCFIQ